MENEEYLQDGYPEEDEWAFTGSNASVAGGIDEDGHLQAEDMWGVQTKIFDITMPAGVTLETLQAKHKNGVNWELPAELKNMLRQVSTRRNRTNAGEDDLVGDLGKFLFLGAEVISEYSDCPKPLGVLIPGLVPNVYRSTGRFNWVIPAGNGSTTRVGEPIFEPDNYFTKYMYQHKQKCDLKTLAQHIRLNFDPTKQVAGMESHGVGWKVLTDNMARGEYASAAEGIYAMNEHIFANPDSQYSHMAKVPFEIAQEIYDAIATPLKEIESAYTDFNTFKVRFVPADGESWANPAGLISESYGFDAESKGYEQQALLNKPINAGIRLRVKYVTEE